MLDLSVFDADVFALSDLAVTLPEVMVPDEPLEVKVNVKVSCVMAAGECPGEATSSLLGSPAHFNLLLKVRHQLTSSYSSR